MQANFVELPVVFKSGRHVTPVFEKGSTSTPVFAGAIAAWTSD